MHAFYIFCFYFPYFRSPISYSCWEYLYLFVLRIGKAIAVGYLCHMDRIDQLRAFVKLVEFGSFTAVAKELRVQQSTISKWLAGTEADLGVQLIDRTTRSQHITDAGRRFYARATSILASYDDAVAEAQEGTATVRGRIRVSLPTVFGQQYVVPLAASFLRQHENVEIELVFADHYVNLVEDGFDVAIRVGVPVDSLLISHFLENSTRRMLASRRYLAQYGKPQTPHDLLQHQCLTHTGSTATSHWTLKKAGKKYRVSVRGRISANNSAATLELVKKGFGISVLASWLVDAEIRSGRLVPLLTNYGLPHAPIRALTAPGRHLPLKVRTFIEHLREGLSPLLNPPVKAK